MWLVLADPLSTRVLVESGVVDCLAERLGERLQPVLLLDAEAAVPWKQRLPAGTRPALLRADVAPAEVPPAERVRRRADVWLDRRIGYFPLAIRLNYRHGLHLQRMRPRHRNELLDSSRVGPLPHHPRIDRAMDRWHFSTRRYVPTALTARLGAERPVLVLSNLQMQSAVPFLVGARRLGLATVGHVASWDHTVGKGVISPRLDRYLVQNERMRGDLVRYHDVPIERIVVTGWPQSDIFHVPRPREAYEAILRGYGLDPVTPLVMVMGNTPTNTPHEERFFARLVAWRRDTGADHRFSLLFRPHPRDSRWRERFAAAVGGRRRRAGAELHRHRGARNAAPARRVRRDERRDDPPRCARQRPAGRLRPLRRGRRPPGESWAAKSVIGEHYRDVAVSGAFHRAESFDEVVAGIERSLAAPGELADERRHVVATVVGEVDGRAAERVVEAMLCGLDP